MIGPTERASSPPGLLGAVERLRLLLAVAIAWGAALLAQMTPLGLSPEAWPTPDLVFCVLAVAAIARPDALPVPAAFGFALVADFVTGGPVGAGALALFLSLETLKLWSRLQDRPSRLRDLAALAAAAAASLLLPWLMMRLTFAGAPPLGALGLRWLATMAAAPLVAGAMRYGLRIRRLRAPVEKGAPRWR